MAKIAIIGTGWGARVQVPTFREAGHEVVAIAGHNAERTHQVASDLMVTPFEDWREAVALPEVDLVSVVTPPSEHLEMAVAALDRGKHVLCEKPTALHASEAMQLCDAARRHPAAIALIDHELRFLPSWRSAREEVPRLGAIRYAEVRYSSPARGDRERAWNWWSDAARGGGIWGAVGSHFIDALRYFGAEIEAVRGMLVTLIPSRPADDGPREVTADDFAAVQLRLSGGGVANLHFSAVATGPDEPSVMTLYCEGGAMRFSGEEVSISRDNAPWTSFAGGAMEKRPGNSFGGAFGSGTLHLARALHDAIDGGQRDALAPAATFDDGLAQQRVLDAARISSSEGGTWVAIAEAH